MGRFKTNFWILGALACAVASSSFAGIRTCEELVARIQGRTYSPRITDTTLEWPKSINQHAETLHQRVENELLPLYRSADHGYFETSGGTKLAYSYFRANESAFIQSKPRGTLVISHGLGESRPQWLDQIQTFVREGYDVFIYEHRGQAHSDRPLANFYKTHISRFSDYEEDLHRFVNEVVKPKASGPVYGVGFSLGGLVSTFNHIKHPNDFEALIAISPAYQIQARGFPVPLVKGLVDLMVLLGKKEEYTFFQKDFDDHKLTLLRQHTHSADRWQVFLRLLERFPMTVPGAPTHGWISQMLDANSRIQHLLPSLRKPMLVLEASQDTLVDPKMIRKLVTDHPWISYYADAKSAHSMIHESDSIRNPAITEMLRFLVHPERLSDSKVSGIWTRLIAQSQNFSVRSEPAFARYAAEEALRSFRSQTPLSPLPPVLKETLDSTQTLLESSSSGQKGLYDFLIYYSTLELEKTRK